ELLAGRNPVVESLEQLWSPLPGSMEHIGALPWLADLFAPPPPVVAQRLLLDPLVHCGRRHVSAGVSLGRESTGCFSCGACLRVQWTHAELPDVAQQHGRIEPDAVGGSFCRTGVAGRRAHDRLERVGWRGTNAFWSARN